MRRAVMIGGLALLASDPAWSQVRPVEFDKPVIAVSGVGRAVRAADWFDITVSLRGSGPTQLEALRALSNAQASVRSGLAALNGVQRLEVRAGDASVVETFTVECERNRDRERTSAQAPCAPTGFAAYASSRFRVRPADRAGEALSLAAERGAVGTRTQDVGVDDPQALRLLAVAAAVQAARAQAEAVARASGVTLGPILRVVDSEARIGLGADDEVEGVVVTGSRVRPAVTLSVDPPPVTQEARVSVVFQIGR